jgi:hypothetical protein
MVRPMVVAAFIALVAAGPVDNARAQGMQFSQDRVSQDRDALLKKCRTLARKAVRRGSRDRSRRIVQYTDLCVQNGGTL